MPGTAYAEWLREDSPGRYFIHYLREFGEYRQEPNYPGKVILDRPAKRVIDFMCHRLNTSEGSILSKTQWFREYWNRSVAVHGIFGAIEHGVFERPESSGPMVGVRRIIGGG